MRKKSVIHSAKHLILFLTVSLVLSISIIAIAALSLSPEVRGEGNESETIVPSIIGAGDGAEVLIPEIVGDNNNDQPIEPFIPKLEVDEPFVDIDSLYDFSEQYDYSYAGMYAASGGGNAVDKTFTAISDNTMFLHMSSYAPFPYGTISADVMNNGGDSGLVFGLSTNRDIFWEGSGISYYFAFINFEGNVFLGKTENGIWTTLAYKKITGFDSTATYNIKVLYRKDKALIFVDDVLMISHKIQAPLSGTGWGIRMGVAGSHVGNIVINNKVTAE